MNVGFRRPTTTARSVAAAASGTHRRRRLEIPRYPRVARFTFRGPPASRASAVEQRREVGQAGEDGDGRAFERRTPPRRCRQRARQPSRLSRMSAWESPTKSASPGAMARASQDAPHVDVLGRLACRPVDRGEEGRETEAPELPLGFLLRHAGHHGHEPLRRLGLDEGVDAGEEPDGRVDRVDAVKEHAQDAFARGLGRAARRSGPRRCGRR